jgi:hypothetical protein
MLNFYYAIMMNVLCDCNLQVTLAILLGCDYSEGVHGVGRVSLNILSWVKRSRKYLFFNWRGCSQCSSCMVKGYFSIFKIQDSACQIVKSVGDSAVLHRIALEGLSFVKKPKVSKKKGHPLSENHGRDANGESNKSCIEIVKNGLDRCRLVILSF